MLNKVIILESILLLQFMVGFLCEKNRNSNDTIVNHNDVSSEPLINSLFSNYKKKIKPNGVVNIKFSLVIEQIVEMVAKDELLILDSWINYRKSLKKTLFVV